MNMDELLDGLERLVVESPRLPLSSRRLISEQDLLAYVDGIREALPAELVEAGRLLRERDRLLAVARQDAERCLAEAKSRVLQLTSEAEISRQAEERAAGMLEQARRTAREIRAGAKLYADEVLSKLAEQLEQALVVVSRGRDALKDVAS